MTDSDESMHEWVLAWWAEHGGTAIPKSTQMSRTPGPVKWTPEYFAERAARQRRKQLDRDFSEAYEAELLRRQSAPEPPEPEPLQVVVDLADEVRAEGKRAVAARDKVIAGQWKDIAAVRSTLEREHDVADAEARRAERAGNGRARRFRFEKTARRVEAERERQRVAALDLAAVGRAQWAAWVASPYNVQGYGGCQHGMSARAYCGQCKSEGGGA